MQTEKEGLSQDNGDSRERPEDCVAELRERSGDRKKAKAVNSEHGGHASCISRLNGIHPLHCDARGELRLAAAVLPRAASDSMAALEHEDHMAVSKSDADQVYSTA